MYFGSIIPIPIYRIIILSFANAANKSSSISYFSTNHLDWINRSLQNTFSSLIASNGLGQSTNDGYAMAFLKPTFVQKKVNDED
jgi:hypothetical protein